MQGSIQQIRSRARFLVNTRRSALGLGERLSYAIPGCGTHSVRDLLLHRLRKAPDGSECFEIDGKKIHFRPDHAITDEDAPLRGAVTILAEAYVSPPDFFHGDVVVRRGDTVLDLGGNIGTSAMFFAELVGPEGRVFTFEPIFHEVLSRNLRENGIHNVEVVPAGVAEEPGEISFAVTDVGIDSRVVGNSGLGAHRERTCTVVSLDSWLAERKLARVDFVKMDIEGAEESAIRGASDMIARFRPKWSIASYHADPAGEKQHPKLVRLLSSLGCRIHERGAKRIYAA